MLEKCTVISSLISLYSLSPILSTDLPHLPNHQQTPLELPISSSCPTVVIHTQLHKLEMMSDSLYIYDLHPPTNFCLFFLFIMFSQIDIVHFISYHFISSSHTPCIILLTRLPISILHSFPPLYLQTETKLGLHLKIIEFGTFFKK